RQRGDIAAEIRGIARWHGSPGRTYACRPRSDKEAEKCLSQSAAPLHCRQGLRQARQSKGGWDIATAVTTNSHNLKGDTRCLPKSAWGRLEMPGKWHWTPE